MEAMYYRSDGGDVNNHKRILYYRSDGGDVNNHKRILYEDWSRQRNGHDM
jgi:tagatose-1,6-bisphosphate aldolase